MEITSSVVGVRGLYLKQPLVTVSELAYLLGFSTQAAFHKAFRRWTNETPSDFRKRHLITAMPAR
jgi:AraC-like DNA-binding protein